VKTRVLKDLLDKLEAACKQTGRSMAQEVAFRLERSFQIEETLERSSQVEGMRSDMRRIIEHAVEEATASAAANISLLLDREKK
jgi:hypothetical protein